VVRALGSRGHATPIVQKLQAVVAKAFEDPEMRELWFRLGAEPGGSSPEEFRDLVARDVAKWGKVVRDAKITVE
jgi:tripartite-type tricarboxylate transporter receptor subunit TctC